MNLPDYCSRPITVNVPLGTMLTEDGGTVHFKARKFFCFGLFSISRTGKTSIVKNVLVRAHNGIDNFSFGNHRRVIVFDPMGEYYKLGEYNNLGEYPRIITDLKVVSDFALPLHLFDNAADWHSFGIAEMGAKLCADLARRVDLHRDDPDIFCQIIDELPANDYQLKRFNEKYASLRFALGRRLPESTVISLSAKVSFLRYVFARPDDRRQIISDLKELVLNNSIVFDLGLSGNESKERAQAYVGVILRQIQPVLEMLHPIIVFEEADFFAPNIWRGDVTPPASLYEIETLVNKMLRYGIGIVFITQSEKLLSTTVVKGLHCVVVGKVDTESKYWHYSEGLWWDYDRGVRQFVFVDENFRAYPFTPDPPDCEI